MAAQCELDLVFAMDCTGSMGSYIEQARDNINSIVETIVAKEHADVHIALVEYRDHPEQDFKEFVTRVLDFTGSVREVRARLDQCRAAGGGDTPEAVADALHDLLKLSWREGSTKICVFISDAPPHALGGCDDGFPNGCPCGLDPMAVAREVAAKGITIYMVGCEPSITPYRDWFMGVALLTGGQYVPLGHANLLSQVIISGAQEALSLQTLMAEVDADVRAQLEAVPEGGAPADQSAVEAAVYKRMTERGSKSKHLCSDVGELPALTANAIAFSEMGAMKDVSKHYSKVAPPSQTHYGARRSRSSAYDAMTSPVELDALSAPRADLATVSRYATVDDVVSYSQCQRLVQKSLVTNNLKSKCAQKTFDDAATKKS